MRRKRDIGCLEAALKCRTHFRVRFSEVDSMQIVWHGEYIRYFEDGREAFGREYPGIGYLDFYANGYTAPVVDLQVQYLSPLTVNEMAIVETRYIRTEAAKLCFEYVIYRESDGAVVARGRSIQVFLDREGNMILNNPPFYDLWQTKWLTQR